MTLRHKLKRFIGSISTCKIKKCSKGCPCALCQEEDQRLFCNSTYTFVRNLQMSWENIAELIILSIIKQRFWSQFIFTENHPEIYLYFQIHLLPNVYYLKVYSLNTHLYCYLLFLFIFMLYFNEGILAIMSNKILSISPFILCLLLEFLLKSIYGSFQGWITAEFTLPYFPLESHRTFVSLKWSGKCFQRLLIFFFFFKLWWHHLPGLRLFPSFEYTWTLTTIRIL